MRDGKIIKNGQKDGETGRTGPKGREKDATKARETTEKRRKAVKKGEKQACHRPVEEKTTDQPINRVQWVDPSTLKGNDYNPNRVFKPEMDLLATSIIENGWTQPIVVDRDGTIIDGFHRWTLAGTHEGVRARSGSLCPVVVVGDIDQAGRIMATIRHNRARGQHGVLMMGEIVRKLRATGVSDKDIRKLAGIPQEEIDRLVDTSAAPLRSGKDCFGKGWQPT